ncbi:MAG: AAA family ATPase [Puniceicoccales bacterium]|jgi:ATP-dependent exoDNAse (exonuclease V) alpha subunit|nr:AAA family ATPase [Puniceicoccales bacterium]
MDKISLTEEHQRAIDLIVARQNVEICGKAGCGKSTFTNVVLRDLLRGQQRAFAYVAPTGMAAINVGGSTIHSFFGFKIVDIFHPEITWKAFKRRADKVRLLRNIDTIVIDEISMVRSDMFDAIELVCRETQMGKRKNLPFGGIQIILVGDFYQLEPVVKEGTHEELQKLYPDGYFLHDSGAFKRGNFVSVEFSKNFRQDTDREFAAILDNIRAGKITLKQLERLNERYQVGEAGITIVGNNQTAEAINREELEKISGKSQVFSAIIEGDGVVAPSPEKLELKPGARVMFTANNGVEWQNGTMGEVGGFAKKDDGTPVVIVRDPQGLQHVVMPHLWTKIEYNTNSEGKLRENVVGKFTQFPIKLAWAITAHKSQGQTLDKATLQNPNAFFGDAAKMLYVALSRVRALDDIRLERKIHPQSLARYGIAITVE